MHPDLAALFRPGTPAAPALSRDEEIDLTARARSGDQAAFLRLAAAYGPLFRREAAGDRGTLTDPEERRAIILAAFVDALHDTPEGEPVRLCVKYVITRALTDAAAAAHAAAVPARACYRFHAALHAATGNPWDHETEAAARALGMYSGEYRAIRAALLPVAHVDEGLADPRAEAAFRAVEAEDDPEDDAAAADAAEAVARVLAALTPRQREIVRLSFGIGADPDAPRPSDAEVAARLGVTRTAVVRARGRALERARDVLGV